MALGICYKVLTIAQEHLREKVTPWRNAKFSAEF